MELNEKTLEEILTRQRREYETLLDLKLEEKLESKLETKLGTQIANLETRLGDRVADLETKLVGVEERLGTAIKLQGDQFERFMGIQVEDLKSQIQLVAEGVSSALEQITQIHTENEERNPTMLQLEVKQFTLESQLESKADRDELVALDARVGKLEANK